MLKKYTIFLMMILCIQLSAEILPVEISTFFSADELNTINSGNIISRMYVKYNFKGENTDKSIEIPLTPFTNENYKDYEIMATEKGFIPYQLTEESKLKFYNTLTSYSKLTGMNYYSRRDAKVTKLIKECYRVESLSGKKHDDIQYSSINSKISNMFFQKDNKFGKLIYRSDLYNEKDNFILINTCLEPISALIFNVNNAEEYKITSFFIYNQENAGYYYFSTLAMRVRSDFLLKNDLFGPTSFSNRLRAASVHLAKLLGLDWSSKLNTWPGKYDHY